MVHKQSPRHKHLRGHRITRPNICRSPFWFLDLEEVPFGFFGVSYRFLIYELFVIFDAIMYQNIGNFVNPSVLLDVDLVRMSLLGVLIDSILLYSHSENDDVENPCA